MVFSDIDLTGLDSIELILQQPIRTLYFKYLVFGLTTNHGNLASLTLVEPQFWYEQIIGTVNVSLKEQKPNSMMRGFLFSCIFLKHGNIMRRSTLENGW